MILTNMNRENNKTIPLLATAPEISANPRAEFAKKVLESGIQPEDPAFPDWRDHLDERVVFAQVLEIEPEMYAAMRRKEVRKMRKNR